MLRILGPATREPGIGIFRIELDRLVGVGDRFLSFTQLIVSARTRDIDLGILWLSRYRFGISRDRLRIIALVQGGVAALGWVIFCRETGPNE